jgi:hypothetical protein
MCSFAVFNSAGLGWRRFGIAALHLSCVVSGQLKAPPHSVAFEVEKNKCSGNSPPAAPPLDSRLTKRLPSVNHPLLRYNVRSQKEHLRSLLLPTG